MSYKHRGSQYEGEIGEQKSTISELQGEISVLRAEIGKTGWLLVQRESELRECQSMLEARNRELAAKDAQLAELRVKPELPPGLPQRTDKARSWCRNRKGAEATAEGNLKWCTVL